MKPAWIRAAVLSATAVALLAATRSDAAQGDYEINQDCVAVGCFAGDGAGYPVSITFAGTFVLSSNLAPPGNISTSAITVSASNVDLDLNGHAVDGGGSCVGTPVTACSGALGDYGVIINSSSGLNVHLHDGTIRGFNTAGVSALSGSGTRFDHLVLVENGYGMQVAAPSVEANTRIENSAINRNGQTGIAVISGVNSRLLVENCEVSGNLGTGLVGGPGSSFVNNRINSNGGPGAVCIPAGTAVCALGRNSFYANATGGVNPQFSIPVLRDMGGNVCMDDGTCP